ncbi:hypothetical protein BGZ81_010316 [Podila clonocystis]|nr:hypothetical protein BGZ81_010316 [Podila clonocystis]
MAIDANLPKFATWFYLHQFKPERAVTSNLISPLMLLVFRLVCSLYATASILENLIANKGLFFAYFTNLSYCGMTAYFWTMTFHTFSIEIVSMYWSQLYSGSFESARVAYREISVHALNSAMILTELCLNRMQLHRRLVVAPLLFISLYMSWTWFVDWIFGFWVYEFMRLAPRVLWIYPCLISFSGVIYFIMYGVNMLKERFFKEEAVAYVVPSGGSPGDSSPSISGPVLSENQASEV